MTSPRVVVVTLVAALGMVTLLVASGAPRGGGAAPTATPSATAKVERRTLNATTQVSGTLGFADAYTIANALATSADPSSALQAYISALSQYNTAANALEALRHPKASEVAAAQAQLAQVEATLLTAEQAAAGASPKDVDQARSQLAAALVQLAKAQESAKGPTAAQIAQAQAALAAAEAQLVKAKAAAVGASTAETVSAQAAVTQAEAKLARDKGLLAQAQAELAACQVASPAPSCDIAALQRAVQEAQSAVDKDEAEVATAKAKLAELLKSSPAQAQAQADLASAQAAVDSAKAALNALTAGVSQSTLAELAAAENAAVAAKAALDAVLSGNPAEAAAKLKTARAYVASAQAALDALLHPSTTQLKQAGDAVSTASLQLSAAEEKMGLPRGLITQLAEIGSVVQPGEVLYMLDGTHPVVLMTGAVPAWRRLQDGMSDGVDVQQLEANLQALGFASSALEVDQHWDAETTAAVKRWQNAIGVAETGVIQFGEVIFEPGPMRITARSAVLGSTILAGASVLQATSTKRVVTIALQTSLQSKVKKDDPVSVTLPDGKTAKGKVTYVGSVAARPEGAAASASPTITVLVTLDDPAAAGKLDQAPVTVNIITATAANVLAVPVGALVKLLDGSYAVQVKDGDQLRYVPVKLGLFAGGWVEVSGPDLAEGQTVVVAQ